MPSLADSAVLFVLALVLFGPKRLPKLAREIGKWVGEFRRASNEFKMQMEEEMRVIERQEREEKIAAIEAAAPAPQIPSEIIPEPEHPHLEVAESPTGPAPEAGSEYADPAAEEAKADTTTPVVPIATSGDTSLMPPATGLPTPRSPRTSSDPLGGLLDRIPSVENSTEPTTHG